MNVRDAIERTNETAYARLVADALRGIGWPQVRGTVLFGVLAYVFMTLIHANFFTRFPPPIDIARSILAWQTYAFCLLVALVVADHAVDRGIQPRTAYLVSGLIGCTSGVIAAHFFELAWGMFLAPDPGPEPLMVFPHRQANTYRPWTTLIYRILNWLMFGGTAVFLYADRRAARKLEAYLRNAELDRIGKSRLAMESRLQAMQARIEPQFLFNTLAQVSKLYEQDAAVAARMLDDLIAYLRAAMPLMRDTSSTVRQEIDLARAYLDIVKMRFGNRLAFDIDVPRGIGHVRMPPMMLLPLIDVLMAHDSGPSAPARSIGMRAEVRESRLRLTITDTDGGPVSEVGSDATTSIRSRLAALYGTDASLHLRTCEGEGTEILMDVPSERPENDVAGEEERA